MKSWLNHVHQRLTKPDFQIQDGRHPISGDAQTPQHHHLRQIQWPKPPPGDSYSMFNLSLIYKKISQVVIREYKAIDGPQAGMTTLIVDVLNMVTGILEVRTTVNM